MYKRCFFILFLWFQMFTVFADKPEPLQLSLSQAEQFFRQNNLCLIAGHYDIDKAEMEVVQAKLFENPVLSLEQNVYNQQNGKYFDFGSQGEATASIQQVIDLAGQHGKQVNVAKINRDVVAHQFEDVIRTLLGELKQQFVAAYFTGKSLSVYDKEIGSVERLLCVMVEQQKKGNVSLMERTRVEAFLLKLRSERVRLLNDLSTVRGRLSLLLGLPSDVVVEALLPEQQLSQIDFDSVTYSRLEGMMPERPDLKAAQARMAQSEANLRLQKSLAAPSFSVGGTYDRKGNFMDNYFAVTASVSIPVFNRNQGNIRGARFDIEQNNWMKEYAEKQTQSELMTAYVRLQNSVRLFRNISGEFEQNFDRLITEVERNFLNRNISMLEFIDYYESYKDSALQLFEVKQAVFASMEDLNTVVGSVVFSY